ncbi:uncharacterized protein LOC125232000 [Leguminivora glycinivorella]|uniref:uncharacterized protein LOC125232000 n=1 Tax=Leguminivora glycinivorella TaxID=1035111 RepID=UPI00200BC157|nr:uncharacterized protein LOC125232000 [Leguminivora glycinivorella]
MARIVIILALLAAAVADPLVFTSPYLPPPFITQYAAPYGYASAALVAPDAAVQPAVQALPAMPGVSPGAVSAAVPLSSVSAYSYGSSYSIQDYAPLVNAPAAPLYSSAYSAPYPYTEWFYRK